MASQAVLSALSACDQDRATIADLYNQLDAAKIKLASDIKAAMDAIAGDYGDSGKSIALCSAGPSRLSAVGFDEVLRKILAIIEGKYPLPEGLEGQIAEVRWILDVVESINAKIRQGLGSEEIAVPVGLTLPAGPGRVGVKSVSIDWQRLRPFALQAIQILMDVLLKSA